MFLVRKRLKSFALFNHIARSDVHSVLPNSVFVSVAPTGTHPPAVPLLLKLSSLYLHAFAALGQVMLYVDGMNGVMEHNETVQWLYALIASKFRLVVKTALKLLLVFVEYVETNCLLLIKAVHAVDTTHGK
jgi:hypothetical protein